MIRTIKIGKRTNDIIARDRKVFLTTTRTPYPFVAEKGEGDYAYDVEGNRFLDFTSFISVYNLGVGGNREIRAAVKEQAGKLMHSAFMDFYSELPVKFAESFISMFPKGFGRMFLSNSGTEANEAAVKFAKIFTKRKYVISFYNGFHGRTMGSLGMTASKAVQREHFGPFTGVVHAPYPYPYRCPFDHSQNECGMDAIGFLEDYVFRKEVAPEEVAAIVMEPIQGEGGYVVPPARFVKEVRRLTKDNGMLLIDDEVQAGYMRTGKFLALDNFGVEADIYTMAKAIGGGLPMGATVVRNSLGDIPEGAHSNTFGGNLAAVAAANASIKYVIRNRARLERDIARKGANAMKRLKEMEDAYGIVGEARGMGLMLAIELVKDKRTKTPAKEEREKIIKECFRNNLLLLEAGESVIRVIPPLTVSDEHLAEGLDILEDSIKKLC